MGRRLGLIIGVNSYADAAFQPLQFAETDARAIAQWLVNTKGGNWSPADVQHIQGSLATRELVETLISQMCMNIAGPGDIVFIYFAGHAFLDETNGEGYLALANTHYRQPATGLHLFSLARQAMAQSRASHVVCILDCFQTGPAWSRLRTSRFDSKPLPGPALLNALQQTGNRLFLCSCRGNEYGAEAGEKNLGLLAYHTIVGLSGPAIEPTTHQVTLQRLHAYLGNTLGEQQRPQLFGQEQTPLVLVGDLPLTPSQTPLNTDTFGSTPDLSGAGMRPNITGAVMSQATYQQTATATATVQMSPTTSGQLSLSEADQQRQQQCTMLLRQARHLISLQNPGEAFNVVEHILQLDPGNVHALILKGQLLGTIGRFREAMLAVQQVLQLDPNNALVWSMQAALLTNMGQYQEALQAVERSLELDPKNPETYAIKTRITGQIAAMQTMARGKHHAPPEQNSRNSASFFIYAGLQLSGLLLGTVGAILPVFQPHLPLNLAFALESIGLALLCTYAARSAYLYGFASFIVTLFFSLIPAALLGGAYKFGLTRIIQSIAGNEPLLLPYLFLGLWLAVAAAVPLVLALFGLIGGLILGVRRKKKGGTGKQERLTGGFR
ncbi:MAG TPA: tetratricopeptide repeat protein [Ktedonobacteraceae bacterium]|nr:tetratricopeptide repeat protein [Ktedonobacteraceae bacterium]